MSVLSIFAPTTSDQQYFRHLIEEINRENIRETLSLIEDLVKSTGTLVRKDYLLLIEKCDFFLEKGDFESVSLVFDFLMREKSAVLKPSDLNCVFRTIMEGKDTKRIDVIPSLFGLCDKYVKNIADLEKLTNNSHIVVDYACYCTNPKVLTFIVKIAEIDPSTRVPLVFSGLIEFILPSSADNEKYLSLLALLLSDSKSRKYFLDMEYVSKFLVVLFSTNVSERATNVFSSLLSPSDLTYLSKLQNVIYSNNTHFQLSTLVFDVKSPDYTIINSLICLTHMIYYHQINTEFFPFSSLFDLSVTRPLTRNSILNFFEVLSFSSPHLLPSDLFIGKRNELLNDTGFSLYYSYISYDYHKESSIKLPQMDLINSNDKILAIACYTQRKSLIKDADLLSIQQENIPLRVMACINILETNPKFTQSVQSLLQPIIMNSHLLNKCFLPKMFKHWIKQKYSKSMIDKWINTTSTAPVFLNQPIFDISPQEASEEFQKINSQIAYTIKENQRVKARYTVLIEERKSLERECISSEEELVHVKNHYLSSLI